MRELTYAQALREALTEEMERDPNVLLMGEDIGVYGGVFKVTEGLMARFGEERVRETPISESGFIGAAVGLAMMGKHPMAELMFMDFAWVAADAIFNQACKMRHIHHEQGTDFVGDRLEPGKVEDSRVGGMAGNKNFRPNRHGLVADGVVIEQPRHRIEFIGLGIEISAGYRDRRTVGQMAAMG